MKHRSGKEKRDKKGPKAPKLKVDLFGVHAVKEAWINPKRHVHALYITDQALKSFDLQSPARRPQPTIVSKEELDRALPPGTVHQGVALSCQPLEEVDIQDLIIRGQNKNKSILVMLDQVTDPHNVGAILRTACVFQADGLILQSKHAPELTGVLAKAACGAAEHTPVAYEINLARALEKLQENGYFAIALDQHGEKTIAELPDYKRAVIVLGAEGPGLRRLVAEKCDITVRLTPETGAVESLNVSNAAAVSLYALGSKK